MKINSTIELYSARKKKTKGTLECSVKKPATSSDSKRDTIIVCLSVKTNKQTKDNKISISLG